MSDETPTAPTIAHPLTPPQNHVDFVPHRVDPLLSFSEAARLIGRSHTTIHRWVEDGLLEAIRPKGGVGLRRKIRKSHLIEFSGVAAFIRQSPYFWVQEAELPDDYQQLDHYPQPRIIDQVTYFPVPVEHFKQVEAQQADSQ